jgi:hypothetical protein
MELQMASAETAASVIGQALAISAAQAMDAALFSANAATAIAPAGILHGVTAIPSAGGTGAPGVADDLALLAQAISNNGIAIDDLIIVTTASLGTKIRVLAGPHFADAVPTSAYIPAGTVIGVIPQGLAAGYAGIAEIETSTLSASPMERGGRIITHGKAARRCLALPVRRNSSPHTTKLSRARSRRRAASFSACSSNTRPAKTFALSRHAPAPTTSVRSSSSKRNSAIFRFPGSRTNARGASLRNGARD